MWIAITVAVASTLSFNYFFFPPVGTFTISEPHNWVSLFAFLVPAIIGSNLSAAAQERARIAVERAQFLEEREAAEIQRQRGELAATLLASLSHDLKTPLTVLRMAVDNLRDDLPIESRRAQADAAAAELRRLTRLFESILDMARIDAAAVECSATGSRPPTSSTRRWPMHATRSTGTRSASRPTPITPSTSTRDWRRSRCRTCWRMRPATPLPIATSSSMRDRGADGVTVSVTDHGPGLDPAEHRSPVRAFLPRAPRAADGARHRHGAGDRPRTAEGDRRPGVGRERAGRRRAVFDGRAGRDARSTARV